MLASPDASDYGHAGTHAKYAWLTRIEYNFNGNPLSDFSEVAAGIIRWQQGKLGFTGW